MFRVISRSAGLSKTQLSRSLPAFSTSSRLYADPLKKNEAPMIDNDVATRLPDEQKQLSILDSTITVPVKVDLTPVSGVPAEHVACRRVRIYQRPKNAMQSGTNNTHHWEMEFDNRQRWENPLMGWTSSGDPLSNMKVPFQCAQDAIEHCEKMGWPWFLDVPKTEKPIRPKNYGLNFHWSRRTRVSTK